MEELLNQLEECKKSSKTGPSAAASQNHIMFVSTFLKSSTQSIPTPFVLNTALYSIFYYDMRKKFATTLLRYIDTIPWRRF